MRRLGGGEGGKGDSYNAFISYSRADAAFATELREALGKYRIPRSLGGGRLRVFRDQSDLVGTEYHRAIETALGRSRKLIVLCSPPARASHWVADEIRRFAATRAGSNIVALLLEGVPNNEIPPGKPTTDAAFPDALCEVLGVPLAVDYRGFQPKKNRFGEAEFINAWYTLLANLLDRSRAEVEERDRLARRRRRTLIACSLLLVVSLVSGLGFLSWQKSRVAESEAIASRATALLESRPERALELAIDAATLAESQQTFGALARVLQGYYLRLEIEDSPDAMTFSRNDELLIARSGGAVRAWSIDDGELAWVAPGSKGTMNPSDGLVATEYEGAVRTWDFTSGKELRSFPVEGTAQIAGNGQRLLISADTSWRVWDLRTGETLDEGRRKSERLRLSENGKYLLWSTFDRLGHDEGVENVTVHEIGSDDRPLEISVYVYCVYLLSGQPEPCIDSTTVDLDVHPHRDVLRTRFDAARGSYQIDYWDLGTGTKLTEAELQGLEQWESSEMGGGGLGEGRPLTTSRDGRYEIWEATGGRALVRDARGGEVLITLRGHGGTIDCASFDSQAEYFATAAAGKIRIWNFRGSLGTAVPTEIEDIEVSLLGPRAETVMIATVDSWSIWEIASAAKLEEVETPPWMHFAADHDFDCSFPDNGTGDWFLVITGSRAELQKIEHVGEVGVYDDPPGSVVVQTTKIVGHADTITCGSINTESQILVTSSRDGTAKVWDVTTGELQKTLGPHPAAVLRAAFDPTGRRVVTVAEDGIGRIWTTSSAEVEVTLEDPTSPIVRAFFDETGTRILASYQDGALSWWEWKDGKRTHAFARSSRAQGVGGRSIEVDGSRVRVLNPDGTESAVLVGHRDFVWKAVWSSDGRNILSWSRDRTVRLWDPDTGQQLLEFSGVKGSIQHAAFSETGREVVVATSDGVVSVVPITHRTLLEKARRVVSRQ